MKLNLTLNFLLFTFFISYSQYTDKFIEITKDISRVQYNRDTAYYKNGNIKKIFGTSIYNAKGNMIAIESGKIIEYSRKGRLKSEVFTDRFGLYLSAKTYNKSGDLEEEMVTTEIDTSLENPKLFFSTFSHIDYKREYRYYLYSEKLKSFYVNAIDFVTVINNEETTIRKFYNQKGETIEIEE